VRWSIHFFGKRWANISAAILGWKTNLQLVAKTAEIVNSAYTQPMKQVVKLLLCFAFMLLIITGARHAFQYVDGSVNGDDIRGLVTWQSDFSDAQAEAQSRHAHLLIEFARHSSQTCMDLARKGWSHVDIVNAASDYVPVMVDIDEQPNLAKQFGIATVPSLVIIDADTKEIIRDGRDSNFSHDELLLWLNPNAVPKPDPSLPDYDKKDWDFTRADHQKTVFSQP
jgi:hypothetical protein